MSSGSSEPIGGVGGNLPVQTDVEIDGGSANQSIRTQLPPPGTSGRSAEVDSTPPNFPRIERQHRGEQDDRPRFEILGQHARGGIGQILIAVDRQLGRQVAVKQLLPPEESNPVSVARFTQEGQITGGLEHPGIVPVYAMGHDADGRPYYAMRFVRGESLRVAIESFHRQFDDLQTSSARLPLHRLLGRMIDVCNVLQYAHSRGVLHRDLKPDNIMLGPFGETLVVDWGLAKISQLEDVQDSANDITEPANPDGRVGLGSVGSHRSGSTEAGDIFGTPAFMSPEQAAGKMGEMGPASDIYSLGATLYQLLTGRVPMIDADVRSHLQRVRDGNLPPPQQVAPTVPRPLAAICRHAMQLTPSDRYASANDLAEDLRRWLAGEPILAYRETRRERMRRWVRQHPRLATGTTVASTISVFGMTAGLILLGAAKDREIDARRMAEQNLQLAEQQFAVARGAVDDFYVRVSEEVLLDQPGLQPVRRQLLQQALQYYQTFARQRSDDPSLRREVALAWYRIGTLIEQLQQPADALAAYEKASQIQTSVDGAEPSIEQLGPLADCVNAIGRVHQRQGNLEAAEEAFERAVELRRRVLADRSDEIPARRKLASSVMNLGVVMAQTDRQRRADQLMLEAQNLRYVTLAQTEDSSTRRDLAMGSYNLALTHFRDGRADSGDRYLSESVDQFEQVLAASPRDSQIRQRLVDAFNLIADRMVSRGQHDEAIRRYGQSSETLQTLAIQNPDVPEYQIQRAAVWINRGNVYHRLGRQAESVNDFRAAVDTLRPLAITPDASPRVRSDLATATQALASALPPDRAAEALQHADKASELLRGLIDSFPDQHNYQQQLEDVETLRQTLHRITDTV